MENLTQKSLVKKLAGYSSLALAGLAVEPARASVIYSGPGFIPVTVAPGETKGISFGGALGSIFQFNENLPISSMNVISALIQRGPNAVATQSIAAAGGNNPWRFGPGYLINAALDWYNNGNGTSNDIAGWSTGFWNDPSNPGNAVRGFLEVRFNPGDGFRYGYFDLSYDNTPDYSSGTLTILGWAYETDANTGIVTAETALSQVPEPATELLMGLGLLALGAAGIRAKRRNTAQGN